LQCDGLTTSGTQASTAVQTIITIDPTIVPETFSACLQFLYSHNVGKAHLLDNCDV
jgi:hypothetical protein